MDSVVVIFWYYTASFVSSGLPVMDKKSQPFILILFLGRETVIFLFYRCKTKALMRKRTDPVVSLACN